MPLKFSQRQKEFQVKLSICLSTPEEGQKMEILHCVRRESNPGPIDTAEEMVFLVHGNDGFYH